MKNIHILPTKETLVDKLKHYFETTSDEQIQKDWDSTVKQMEGVESPDAQKYIEECIQNSLEKAAKQYYEENIDTSNIPREHYEQEIQNLMIGFAYKWQQLNNEIRQ